MSVCLPCLQVCRVPLCTAEIILGTISSISTDVNILIENKSTGAKKIVATQSDNTGKVTLVTSGLSLMADQSYEISVLLKTATALCDKEILTIGTSTASCVTVIFENIKDSTGCQVSFESQTLTPITENTQPGTNCLCVTQAMLDALNCCEPIRHTFAEMFALIGSFSPFAWYEITDAQSSFGLIRVRAINASNLEKKATLLKGGISYDVSYVIDNGSGGDVITYLRDDINNNTLSRFPDVTDGVINLIPFDGSWGNNVINSGSYTISDITKCVINNSELHSCSVIMNDNGSTNPVGCIIGDAVSAGGAITISGKNGGQQAHIFGYRGGVSCNVLALNGAGVDGCRLEDNSTLAIDDNGADGSTGCTSVVITNNSVVNVTGVSGGTGTTLNSCSIFDLNGAVSFLGGEAYLKKELNPSLSTFDGSRVIAADGTFSFIDSSLVANYNRSFVGIWTISGVAPHNITSFSNRVSPFGHDVTFILGAGSSAMTFVDNGTDIIMKGSANATLANLGDFVTFRFVGQVGYEINRGIY